MNKIMKYGVATIGMIVFFCSSLYLVSRFCPQDLIQTNVRDSVYLFTAEGVYPYYNGKGTDAGQDNFTDSLMLNINYHICPDQPWHSAMAMSYTKMTGDFIGIDALQTLDENTEKIDYARYWHGYNIFLRPLLTITNYEGIRKIQMAVLVVLCLLTGILIWYRWGFGEMLLLVLGMICVKGWRIPLSIQYMGIFVLMLLAICALGCMTGSKKEEKEFPLLFYVLGGCTSFIDLLTCPIVVLGVPLLYLLLYLYRNRNTDNGKMLKTMCRCVISWGVGYVLIWGVKWGLGTITLGTNIVQNALEQSRVYIGNGARETGTIYQAIRRNTECLLKNDNPAWKAMIAGLIMLAVLAAHILGRKTEKKTSGVLLKMTDKKTWTFLLCLVAIAIMPYVWYCVMGNHSYVHSFFTYRNQIITVMAAATILLVRINR